MHIHLSFVATRCSCGAGSLALGVHSKVTSHIALSLHTHTLTAKEFNVNWNRPDAQGTFGRVYFAKQGLMGMGGQVVVKFPVNNNFALNTFETERVVNQRLDSVGSP
jgi:hypothetical protein